jgi:hypothetical protein
MTWRTLYFLYFNPNPNCLGILKGFFVKMKISPGWLKQNIFKNQKCLAKSLTNFFASEVFIKNVIFSMRLMII